MKLLDKEFFSRDTVIVAKQLLGKIIEYKGASGIIVEAEAYKGNSKDKASHAHKKTKRSAIMFDSYGKFYIYFVYGNHFCMNITAEKNKPGAVLLRALQPLKGIEIMKKRRNTNDIHNLASGPGKLCQALAVTKALNGTALNDKIKVYDFENLKSSRIISTKRIGIEKAKNLPWRFYIKGNHFVSKK